MNFSRLAEELHSGIRQQTELADVVIINKSDLADPATLGAIANQVRALNPRATLFITQRGVLDYDQLGTEQVGAPGYRYRNRIWLDAETNLPYKLEKVSQKMAGSDQGLNGLSRVTPGNTFEANKPAMVWSFGPDGKVSDAVPANAGVNKDNILSW